MNCISISIPISSFGGGKASGKKGTNNARSTLKGSDIEHIIHLDDTLKESHTAERVDFNLNHYYHINPKLVFFFVSDAMGSKIEARKTY